MKTLFTIIFLSSAFLFGSISADAKKAAPRNNKTSTATKNTSKTAVNHSSNTLTASTFVKKGPYSFTYRSDFEKNLINLGFEKISYLKTYEGEGDYDDGGTKRTFETKYSLTRNGKSTTVIIQDEYFNDDTEITTRSILIYLPNKSETDQFIKTIKSLGYTITSIDEKWGTEYQYKYSTGLCFRVKNNEICIFDMIG